MYLKTRQVGGMWEVGNEKQGRGTAVWGLGDQGQPAAGACQHHSHNLSWGSKKPTNLEKEFFFLRE
jgi:hypothetical protein